MSLFYFECLYFRYPEDRNIFGKSWISSTWDAKKGSENLQITSKKGRILIYLTTSLMDAKVPSSHTLTGQNQKNPGNSMSQEKPLWDLNHVLKFLRPRWKSYWLLGTVVGHLQYQHWKGQDRINLGLRLAQFQWVPSLLGLHIETLSQKIKRKERNLILLR